MAYRLKKKDFKKRRKKFRGKLLSGFITTCEVKNYLHFYSKEKQNRTKQNIPLGKQIYVKYLTLFAFGIDIQNQGQIFLFLFFSLPDMTFS